MFRSRTLLAAGLLLLAGCSDPPPHIFLITADALRADHLSYTGYPRLPSPQIDAFAAESIVFSQAVTLVPKTGPSFASHMTGLDPAVHGVTSNLHRLPDDVPLLPEILREHGYATAAFVSNPVLSKRKGYDRGFDVYERFVRRRGSLDQLSASFAEWFQEASFEKPTFVWIHFIDPHGPYTPPDALRDLFTSDEHFAAESRVIPIEYDPPVPKRRNRVLGAVPHYQQLGKEGRVAWYVSQYDAEIRHMDDTFGRILGLVRDRGLFEDAGIVFTADHGESLGEHDYFFEHGWYTYDATLRIPLLLKPPGPPRPGTRDDQVSILDTTPTLLELAGFPAPPDLPGHSLLAGPRAENPVLAQNVSTYSPRFVALRTPRHKWILQLGNDREQLYDLAVDPGESENLVDREPELAAQLRETAERIRDANAALGERAPEVVEPTAAEADQLRALGYLGD
jgi:arylsulfatase A-like enzyme